MYEAYLWQFKSFKMLQSVRNIIHLYFVRYQSQNTSRDLYDTYIDVSYYSPYIYVGYLS